MKPIVFITKMQGGGMETFCLGLLNAWVVKNVEATLYLSYSGGERTCDIPKEIETVCWDVRAKYSFFRLARWLRTRPNDPCLALSQELAVVLVILKRLHLIMNPLYFRESDDVVAHYSRKFKRIMCWMWPHLDGIIEQSYAGRDATQAICNGKLPPCRVVRNIMSADKSADNAFAVQTPAKLACVSSYRPKKRQDLLVDMLAEDIADDWQLTLWGDGEKKSEVQDLVVRKGLSGRIVFNNWEHDKEKIYSETDIVVIPSDYEGLPNVMLEAILHGKRVSVRPTCVGACELLDEIGIGDTWPWRKALEIPVEKWNKAKDALIEICNPKKVAADILSFISIDSSVPEDQ